MQPYPRLRTYDDELPDEKPFSRVYSRVRGEIEVCIPSSDVFPA